MRIKLATQGWNGATKAEDLAEAKEAVRLKWAELTDEDGNTIRTNHALEATVNLSNGIAIVTVTFSAAPEVILVGGDGSVLAYAEGTLAVDGD